MFDTKTINLISILQNCGVKGEPCDDWLVKDLEQQLGIKLPAAYKAFLLLAGHDFTPFHGSQYTLDDDLSELQRNGQNIFRKDHEMLPLGSFVFFVHQGFVIRFFLLEDGDDPPVFEYVKGWPPAKQLAPRFSEFLKSEING